MKEIKIWNYTINENSSTFIIAELSANHGWDIKNAKEIIKAAAEAWADAIKLQTYTADTMTIDCKKDDFMINSWTEWDWQSLYELYWKAYTPWEWHKELMDYTNSLWMEFFSTPFDDTAVDFLEELWVPSHKIASFENTDIPLIKKVAQTGKPIIISTWMASYEDIKLAVDTIRWEWNNQIILLKCTSSYPAPYEEINLKTIESFKKDFNVIPWLSDHTLWIEVPIASVVLWAKVIEKHFCLSRDIPTADSHFSLEPQELKQMVKSIRNIEKALWTPTYHYTNVEKWSLQFRRSIYLVKDIKKWEKLTEENIRVIRPGFWLEPKYFEEVLWKTINQNLEKWTALKLDYLNN